MNFWTAIISAEFRRAVPLLPWVAALHLLMFCIRTGLGPQIGPRLAYWVELSTWALAAWILIPSLWSDSPSRRETFIATRPVKPLALYTAKFAGLIALVVMPFVAVEFASLLAVGFPLRVLCLGTLQMLVLGLGMVLFLFPAVWLWRARWSAAVGWALMLGSVFLMIRQLARWQTEQGYAARFSPDALLYPPVLLLALALATLCLACLLACPVRIRGLVKVSLCIPAVCLPAYLALWMAARATEPPRGEEVPLASLYLSSSSGGARGSVYQFQISLPTPPAPADIEVEKRLVRLEVNGRDYYAAAWQGVPAGSQSGWSVASPAIQQALRKHYGEGLKLPKPQLSYYGTGQSSLPLKPDERGKLAFNITQSEITLRWDRVGELPVVPGASLTDGAITWSIEEPGRSAIPHFTRQGITLCQRFPAVWFGSLQNAAASDSTYRFFLLLPDGRVLNGSGGWAGDTGLCSALRVRHIFLMSAQDLSAHGAYEYEPAERRLIPKELPEGSRLVILRSAKVAEQHYSWRSPEPLKAPQPVSYDRDEPASPRATSAMEWLKDHPAPASDAADAVISAWLGELLERSGKYSWRSKESETVIKEIARFVPSRPDLVLAAEPAAETSSLAGILVDQALRRGITRDAVKRFRGLGEDGSIIRIYWENGWFEDVAHEVARQVRLGNSLWRMEGLLLTNPGAAGFSEAEWLAFFRLYPTGGAYRVLRGKYLPSPVIEREADAVIARSWEGASPLSFRNYPEGMSLELARGRADAPGRFREWIIRWRESGSGNPGAVHNAVHSYFEFPADAGQRDALIEWFMAQDPAAFRFDETTGKFRLP